MTFPNRANEAYETYSELEIANDRSHLAPELDLRDQPDKEAVYADHEQHDAPPKYSQRRLCGMRRPIAYVVFAIVALVIIGAVIGGAVGGTQASSTKNRYGKLFMAETQLTSRSSPAAADSTTSISPASSTFTTTTTSASSTTSATSTTSTGSASATPIGDGEGTYTCPESNDQNYVTSSGTGKLTFRQLCGVDWPSGVTAQSGSVTSSVEDLSTVLEYSLEQCIEQCAVYSINNSPGCVAVTYGANVTLAQGRGYGGNCWLKSARGASNLADTSGQEQAAYLLGS